MKMLGTIVNNTLSWDENYIYLIKKVQHANIERLKKSSIIAMQKMLNHNTRTEADARKIVIL